jgi:hypothetical protein
MSARMARHYVLLSLWLAAYQCGLRAARVRGFKYQARYRRYLQLAFVVAGERSL